MPIIVVVVLLFVLRRIVERFALAVVRFARRAGRRPFARAPAQPESALGDQVDFLNVTEKLCE